VITTQFNKQTKRWEARELKTYGKLVNASVPLESRTILEHTIRPVNSAGERDNAMFELLENILQALIDLNNPGGSPA
jgi:hypothetical protein